MFDRLRRIFGRTHVEPTPPLPQNVNEIGDYREKFEYAISFTKRCGFDAPKVTWVNRDMLTPDGVFLRKAGAAAGIADLADSAGQCLKWCHYLRPHLEQTLGVSVWLTIGQLWANNRATFDPSWDDLQRWSKSGIHPSELVGERREGINLHAWLTVATGEIIEPTLLSSLARIRPKESEFLRGIATWGREPEFIKNYRYFPMVAGDEIAEAIGGHPQFPLLARSKDDLMKVAKVAMFYEID